jgi:hypothetical protein
MAKDTATLARLEKSKRHYNAWVVNETLEDYSLRYAPRSFRRWSDFTVANTALGGISYLLADFAIGGSIAISSGFTNSFLQVWTQPIWLLGMFAPWFAVWMKDPTTWATWYNFAGKSPSGAGFNALLCASGLDRKSHPAFLEVGCYPSN